MRFTLENARSALQRHWGHADFRRSQVPVIEAVAAGSDVLAVLPTGEGKSACFQIPALLDTERTALVVSPLIALMKDQCDDAERRGIAASFVNSHIDEAEADARLRRLADGEFRLFYVSPETLKTRRFRAALQQTRVSYLVVDEAHCHPAGTRISTPTGDVPIETIQAGDAVYAYDGQRVVVRRVTETQVKFVGCRRLLRLVAPSGSVLLTDDHPVFVIGKGYVAAGQVNTGDEVLLLRSGISRQALGADGGEGEACSLTFAQRSASVAGPEAGCAVVRCRVDRVEVVERPDYDETGPRAWDDRVVFALTVAGEHNYFAEGILTHNCASRWGHDFRPAYLQIADCLRYISQVCPECDGDAATVDAEGNTVATCAACGGRGGTRPQIIAVTATATGDIEADIMRSLGVTGDYTRIVADPIRPNLDYRVVFADNDLETFKRVVGQWDIVNGRHIVYVGTRKMAELLTKIIAEQIGFRTLGPEAKALSWQDRCRAAYAAGAERVAFYHAGMKRDDSVERDEDGRTRKVLGRVTVQENFKSGRTPVVVATCAFGMGIDVPNIRNVLHFGVPGCLEDYAQEAGRAGRDGQPSAVTIIYSEKSVSLRKWFIDQSNPRRELYDLVWSYLLDQTKRVRVLRKSAASIAYELCAEHGPNTITDAQVHSILSALELRRVIRRAPAASGSEIKVNVAKLRAAASNPELNRTEREVADYLLNTVVEPTLGGTDLKTLDVVLDREDIANAVSRSEATVKRALDTLEEDYGAITVSPTFNGKSTELLSRPDVLDDVLPWDEIEAKRAREIARLERMLSYCRSSDKRQAIRDYFLKGPVR